MHVDDAVDELLYKEKNNYIEAQEKALKKMHIDHILGKEQFLNKLRDFQGEESIAPCPKLAYPTKKIRTKEIRAFLSSRGHTEANVVPKKLIS